MPESTLPAPQPGAEARPVDVTERITLLDALRGFALCGVFISNSVVWFSGRTLLPREQAQALTAPPLEAVTNTLYQFFVNQKFITLFSFLFGLGFSIQLTRAQSRGASIVPLYSRRLLVLLGIGVVHIFGLWVGDILHTYALVGFVLLLFRARSDRTALVWAAVLLVVVPLALPALHRFVPVLLHGAEAAAQAAKDTQSFEAQERAALLVGLSSDSFWTSQAANARYFVDTCFRFNRLVWMSVILAKFLLGLLAGRHRLLHDVEAHRAWFRRMLVWGLVVGVLGNGSGVVVQRLRVAGLVDPVKDTWMMVVPTIQELGFVALAAAYVATFALLLQRGWWQRVMGVLSPVGRMALTNYLMQSAISICIYDGWGLGFVGKMPMSRCIALCLVIFAAQVVFSHAWLARFRFGPAEWLWRSLTYGRAQPMRLDAKAGTAGAQAS